MAEIGVIASVIGVAGAGFRLSIILNAVGSEFANAGMEVLGISRGITLFSLMLKQLGQTLQTADSVHTVEAEQAASQIKEECELVFTEISEMLEACGTRRKDGSFGPTTLQKFKWCFKKHRVTYLLAQLDSLKLSLSVMLQILWLGKIMAAAPPSVPTEEVAYSTEEIQRERVETQNVIIIRYWQINHLDALFEKAEQEDIADRKTQTNGQAPGVLEEGTAQLTLEPPPHYNSSNALVKLPVYSLGELDQSMHQIRQSPKDMLHVSNQVINPLLDRWTRWQEIHERSQKRESGGSNRYAPFVQNTVEEEENRFRRANFHDHEESPRGYYIEGQTSDWRKPQSAEARRIASRLRREYSDYQPSVSVDDEDGYGFEKKIPKERIAHRHAVDSSSESSEESEHEDMYERRRRKSSGSPTTEKKPRSLEGLPGPYTYSPQKSTFGGRYSLSPGSTPRPSVVGPMMPIEHRPIPNPMQNPMHHSMSLPPLHTGGGLVPYGTRDIQSVGNPSPSYAGPNGQTHPYSGPNRYVLPQQQRMPPGLRPGSSDGKTRSPSRASHHSYKHRPLTAEQKAAIRARKDKNFAKSATKGILGAGAIATFLEALEGLDV